MENPSEFHPWNPRGISRKTAILLCISLGVTGIHRFYINKGQGGPDGNSWVFVSGVIQFLITVGLFLLWLLFDNFNGFVNAVLYGGFTTYFYGFFYAYSLVDIIWMHTDIIEDVRWREDVERENRKREEEKRKREEEKRKREEENRKREEENRKREEENRKREMEWKREFENKIANFSAEEAIVFLEKELSGGTLSSAKHSYLKIFVSGKKREEERKERQEWERAISDKLANVSVRGKSKEKIIKELSDGNLSTEQRYYLERIVKEKREEDKIKKQQEYIQNKKDFFQENKLTVMEKGNEGVTEYPKLFIRDENYQEYELEEERMDFIVYKPEGMRGKRAFIKTDSDKNYLAWSGPIDKKDKARFLRGDFEKVKEESGPKEEATVQDQESENVEVKQEKELESSDVNMSVSERLNKLTKLYEEGELTEEEYKQKTNELIS